MSRRNQKPHHKPAAAKSTPRPTGAGGLGLKAFHTGNYTEAIRLWNEPEAGDEPAVRAAIAEAHFRRALGTRLSIAEAVADLRHAVGMFPEEARYWYQLGLMLHRSDQLEEARKAYAQAAELGLVRRGIGLVRGLAELEADPKLFLDSLQWLTLEARTALVPIARLLRGESDSPPKIAAHDPVSAASSSADPITSLWQGLTLLENGEAQRAYLTLSPPKGQRLPLGAEPTRAFYFGVAAALAGKPQIALTAWQELSRLPPVSAPSRPTHLSAYMSQISAHSILALQQEGRWEAALAQAQIGVSLAPGDTWLLQAVLISANRLATTAREAGSWASAIECWQVMCNILKQHPKLGPLPPLLRNIAIANEALEEWEEAAIAWGDLLNTLPKRSGRASKNSSPASVGPSPEEQRVWMRRRILDNYHRAELPDEAITYYKQAVKADPENLELRLEMASALLANDQSIAARNEVQRILDKDPKHIPTLMLLAAIHQDRDEHYAAEQALIRVLDIDPKLDAARNALVQMLRERGVEAFNSGRYPQAQDLYEKALTYAPNDPQMLVFLGQSELIQGRVKQAQPHFDAALATGHPDAYLHMFVLWGKAQDEVKARKILRSAEEKGVADSGFYLRAGVTCLTQIVYPTSVLSSRRPKAPPLWETWGRQLIEKGLDTAEDRVEALEKLMGWFEETHPGLAAEYARRLVELKPDDPECYLDLAIFQGFSNDVKGAKSTLTQAERLARKQGRKDLFEPIAKMREELAYPWFGLPGSFFGPGGLNLDDLED